MRAFTRTPVYMGQFANGDDTDETAAITRAFAAAAGKTLEFEPGKTYRVSSEIVPGAGTTVKQNGATLNIVSTGMQRCIVVPTGLDWQGGGGLVKNIGSGTLGHGGTQCPFVLGDYQSGVGVHSVSISGVMIENTMAATNGILVTGDSHDVTLENITFPDSATINIPILTHWGGVDVRLTTGTTHPHNVKINNITLGNMSRSTGGGACVYMSGCYGIAIENITAGNIQSQYGLLSTWAGDYGGYYASAAIKELVCTNIHAKNTSALSAKQGGIILCKSYLAPVTEIYPGPTYENFSIASVDAASIGLAISYCAGAKIINPRINGGNYGIATNPDADRVHVVGGEIKNCQLYGIDLLHAPVRPVIDGVKITNCGVGGAVYAAQIHVDNAVQASIKNCNLGLASGETCRNGVRLESAAVDCDIVGNHCNGVASGGVAFSFASSTDQGMIKSCRDNSADSGVTLYGGSSPLVTETIGITSVKIRRAIGTAAPTTGAWNKGDRVEYIYPALYEGSYSGAACVVAGTPGTWNEYGQVPQPVELNQFLYTEVLSNAAWQKNRCTITDDAKVAPDGATTVDTMLCNETSDFGMYVRQFGMTLVADLAYTISCYFEKGTDDWALLVASDGSTNAIRQWFNLNTGAVGTSNPAGTGWAKVRAKIAAWGSGYRCELAFTYAGTDLSASFYPSVSADGFFGCVDAVTTGYVWGTQLDRGITALTYRPRTS